MIPFSLALSYMLVSLLSGIALGLVLHWDPEDEETYLGYVKCGVRWTDLDQSDCVVFHLYESLGGERRYEMDQTNNGKEIEPSQFPWFHTVLQPWLRGAPMSERLINDLVGVE